MPTKAICIECGAELSSAAFGGLCTRCALQLALKTEPGDEVSQAAPVTEKPGDRIGRYRLLEKIGEGGFGVVYMAQQEEPVSRRVAVKILKPGMDTLEVIARFDSERQALALMDHPHIAKIFDGGATDMGRPFFVMELVRGIPITKYCDQKNLSTRERLGLFIQVCGAVQHAHQKGLIHRDLKPSNILVTENDGLPVPKVIDFGVAKAMGQRLTDKTLFTRFQQILGTPDYMSPEQAEMSSVDIDTRSDIYSLGVLLYQLLTGRTPFETKMLLEAGLEEVLRTIREREPPRPSARLRNLTPAEQTSVAHRHQTDTSKLLHQLSGDLDWIVMQCLAKDRARRYESASALAKDVQRHLNREPVTARPPTALYRIRTFARRNRVMVAVAGLVISTLILGVTISSRMYFREFAARQRAEVAEKHNEQLAQTEREHRLNAEEQTRIANSMRLVAQSQSLRSQAPSLSALLALEAVEVTRREQKPVLPAAHESLIYSLAFLGGQALSGHDQAVKVALISPDGHWLVTAAPGSLPQLRDLRDPSFTAHPLPGGSTNTTVAAFSPDTRLLVTGSLDGTMGTVRLWGLDRPMFTNSTLLNAEGVEITQLAFSPSGRWLGIQSRHRGERLIVRDLNLDRAGVGQKSVVDHSGEFSTAELIVTPDGPWLVKSTAGTLYPGGFRLWDLTTPEPKTRILKTNTVSAVIISPNGHWVAAAIQNGLLSEQLFLLDLRKQVLSSTGMLFDLNWLTRLAFSGDDRFLAIASGRSVSFLDLGSDVPGFWWRHLGDHASSIHAVTMSRDGRWLASGDADGTVRLWDMFSGVQEPVARVLSGHTEFIHSMLVTPDGRWLATGSKDNSIRLWPLASKTPEVIAHVLRGHDSSVSQMAITPDSRLLVTIGAQDPVPRIWDLEADAPGSREIVLRTSGSGSWLLNRALHLSPDGHWLVGPGTPARVWDLSSENPAKTRIALDLPRESSQSGAAAPLNDIAPRVISSRWLVTERRNDSRRLWDLKAKDPAISQQPLVDGGGPTVNRRDERWLALAKLSQEGWPDNTGPICISPDEKWLAVASSGTVQLWDLRGNMPTNASLILRGGSRTASLGISPDSRWLVAGDADHLVRVWDLSLNDPQPSMRTLVGHSNSVSQVRFGAGSRWLFTADPGSTVGNSGSVHVWHLGSGEFSHPISVVRPSKFVLPQAPHQRGEVQVSLHGREIQVSPDGRWIFTVTTTTRWDADNFELWHLPAQVSSNAHRVVQARGNGVVFSPNSRWLITTADRLVTLWDLTAGAAEPTKQNLYGQAVFDTVAFSPDSHWLATASLDGTTRLWDLQQSTLTPVVLRGNSGSVRTLGFTGDGRWLVTRSDDGTARLWDINLDRLVTKVRNQVGRDFTPEERKTYHLEAPR